MIISKPEWLRKKASLDDQASMNEFLKNLGVETVCQQALCPNMSECFKNREATFLILGTRCTRNCLYCNIEKGTPIDIDPAEPERIGVGVAQLRLSHVVITSPTRDDLPDGGAKHFAATVKAVRVASPTTRVEILIPDFAGDLGALETVVAAGPDILGHNLETISRLYNVRSGADYRRSLQLLRHSSILSPKMLTKSGLMLGMGETIQEVVELLSDLKSVGCSYLSIGHYLPPSKNHYPVQEYVKPKTFEYLGKVAKELGFDHVESSPFTRSSYHAGRYTKLQSS